MARYKTDISMVHFQMAYLDYAAHPLGILEDELNQFIGIREADGWEVVNVSFHPEGRNPFTCIQFRKEIREQRDTGPL